MCVVRSRRRHRGGHWQGQEEIPAKNGVCVCDWEKSGAGAHRNRIRSVWRQGLSHSTAWPVSSIQSSKLQREGSLSPTLQVSQSTKSTQELPYLAIIFAISDTIQMATFTAFRCANLVPHSFRTRNELRAAEDITTGPVPVEMAI